MMMTMYITEVVAHFLAFYLFYVSFVALRKLKDTEIDDAIRKGHRMMGYCVAGLFYFLVNYIHREGSDNILPNDKEIVWRMFHTMLFMIGIIDAQSILVEEHCEKLKLKMVGIKIRLPIWWNPVKKSFF